ncbi:aminopeptidase P family protein [Brumimicrobium glaciale]|uniref:Aminopeptidase P family protein n=1 Tax=Brumimicrobium glaciale TaxID=200475 RepID=A0A4Q4KN47_9FLAO|nr:M24 family metallopeptidase [Brumimicrobium glaciale]RYM33339.1 aminopeptidase P family protein [Brumimicrobium glaciale]
MNSILNNLIEAEKKAIILFQELENRALIQPGITEKELNIKVYELANELFGIKKYWHKRIVRAGENTLLPYAGNPPSIEIKEDDIIFLDFGPVFEEWEADFGRTYVLGNDPNKKKLTRDIELAWHEGKAFYDKNFDSITSSELYAFTVNLAKKYGWEYGNEHCGHLIGNFPHEKLLGEEIINYIHPDNHVPMSAPDKLRNKRYWIYEIHFVDLKNKFGGFFEQMV